MLAIATINACIFGSFLQTPILFLISLVLFLFSFGLFQNTPGVLLNKAGLFSNKAGLFQNNPRLLTSHVPSGLKESRRKTKTFPSYSIA